MIFDFLQKYYRYLHLFECCFVGCLHVEAIIYIFPTSFLQTYCHIWMNYNKGNQPPWKQNTEEIYGVLGHKKISHSPKEMTEIWPAWDDSNVRQTRLRSPSQMPKLYAKCPFLFIFVRFMQYFSSILHNILLFKWWFLCLFVGSKTETLPKYYQFSQKIGYPRHIETPVFTREK